MHQLLYKHLLKIFFCISIFCTASYIHVWCNCSSSLKTKQTDHLKMIFFLSKVFASVFYSVFLDKTTPLKLQDSVHRTVGELWEGSGSGSCREGITPGWWLGLSGAHQGSLYSQFSAVLLSATWTEDLSTH